VDADELEIRRTLLEILEVLLEVRPLVVGDDYGVVLGRVDVSSDVSRSSTAVSRSCHSADESQKRFS
jgi:hypothetical protein